MLARFLALPFTAALVACGGCIALVGWVLARRRPEEDDEEEYLPALILWVRDDEAEWFEADTAAAFEDFTDEDLEGADLEEFRWGVFCGFLEEGLVVDTGDSVLGLPLYALHSVYRSIVFST